jgi:hypothetical protein
MQKLTDEVQMLKEKILSRKSNAKKTQDFEINRKNMSKSKSLQNMNAKIRHLSTNTHESDIDQDIKYSNHYRASIKPVKSKKNQIIEGYGPYEPMVHSKSTNNFQTTNSKKKQPNKLLTQNIPNDATHMALHTDRNKIVYFDRKGRLVGTQQSTQIRPVAYAPTTGLTVKSKTPGHHVSSSVLPVQGLYVHNQHTINTDRYYPKSYMDNLNSYQM